jgi:TPR repeat protein
LVPSQSLLSQSLKCWRSETQLRTNLLVRSLFCAPPPLPQSRQPVAAADPAAAHVLNAPPRRRTMAGGSGKKARGRANKASKQKGGEAATPPAVPSSSVPRTEEESTYNWTEWLAEEEEGSRKVQTRMTKAKEVLASADDPVQRERIVKGVLCMVAGDVALTSVEGPSTYIVVKAAAMTELTELWEVAAAAAIYAAAAAAAVASAKTPAARAKAKTVAETAASEAVASATTAFAGDTAICERLSAAVRAGAAEELEWQRQQTAAGASGSGGKASTGITAVPATETAPPPSTSAQTAATKEERTAAAAATVSEEAMAAPTHASDRDALVSRLDAFAQSAMTSVHADLESWVASEFSGDWAAVAAAAEGGDAKAQFAMSLAPQLSAEERRVWMQRAVARGHPDACLHTVLGVVYVRLQQGAIATLASDKDMAMTFLKLLLASGSAPAQYVAGMLLYIFDCGSGAREDFLDAARYIRKAAKQGLAEAQYELGEMCRKGVFCDVHMRFARKHIRRASRQGHAEAVARMRERRSCAFCGADDAPRACGLCRKVRYCDNGTCCVKHWREGGGVGGGIIGGGAPGARHKDVCPRTHAAMDESDDGESDEEDEELGCCRFRGHRDTYRMIMGRRGIMLLRTQSCFKNSIIAAHAQTHALAALR